MNKNILRIIHDSNICKNACYIKYPWGWKSRSEIKEIINGEIPKSVMRYNVIENDFIDGSKYAYDKIYESYVNKINFLDYSYTNPKLSNALNFIRSNIDESSIIDNIEISKCKVIGTWHEHGYVQKNSKYLGLYSYEEILHEISTGIIGPEMRYIWDQMPIRQKVRVYFKSKNYLDVVDFEKDIMLNDQKWQVCNINKII